MSNTEEELKNQETIDIEVQENTETKDKIDNADVSMLLDQIKFLKTEIENNKPKPKVKRQATEKQLEQLKRAREIKAKNTQLRKEVAKNKKIEEKKIVNEEVEKLKKAHNKEDDEVKDSAPDIPPIPEPDPTPEPVVKNTTPRSVNFEDDIPDIPPSGFTGGYSIYSGSSMAQAINAVPSKSRRRGR